MSKIPSFVRGVVMQRVEDFARSRGLDVVTPELLGEIRKSMPVDFSKRRPFFLGDDCIPSRFVSPCPPASLSLLVPSVKPPVY